MASRNKTRDVPKSAYANYFKKAEECFHAAQSSLQTEEWNAVAINAIHCCISACDAACVYFLGKRHSGEDHNDAATLFKSIRDDQILDGKRKWRPEAVGLFLTAMGIIQPRVV